MALFQAAFAAAVFVVFVVVAAGHQSFAVAAFEVSAVAEDGFVAVHLVAVRLVVVHLVAGSALFAVEAFPVAAHLQEAYPDY